VTIDDNYNNGNNKNGTKKEASTPAHRAMKTGNQYIRKE
jgi:hypothetical protein